MRIPLAWFNLVHEKTRLLVAIAGVSFAVLLVFMNLGFFGALAKTASTFYNQIDAEIYLVSPQTNEFSTTKPFPRSRIYQAAGIEGVKDVMPLYLGYLQWRNPQSKLSRAMFVFGINPHDSVFLLRDLQLPENQKALLEIDTVLIDRLSRPEFGSQNIGITTQAKSMGAYRQVKIGGQFSLGGGFAADGTLIMSDQNFRRFFDPFPLDRISLGLIKLKEGVNTEQVVKKLRQTLPKDVEVMTKQEIAGRDRDYWINATATGFIFGMGVVVSCIVGIVIVYQILYADVYNHLRQYATLRAMGYRSRYLCSIVIQEAVILAVLGYIPGFIIAFSLYELARTASNGGLPIAMEFGRAVFVLFLTILMCTLSGLISIRKVMTADPAEVF
ncbi:glycolipid ABC exporter inner membrane subunit [Calothrix parasitica NIES-267]|uniref:Glycolipid ABC exporter inner membrane subunit n=1 Tax=Calothrix parasitica NIES-267 TaxID=1973488 RepID=A0A1Z4LT68_9CYAN|nr:glycolipid ABC exporter inner membrane subunit [Calothrix parasitica NIES-267]